MVISHNIMSMNSLRQYNIVTGRKRKSSEKLASGYRINRASDDAAGLSISEKMRRQIRGLTQGVNNTEDAISLCQVADGALSEVSSMLHRITELSVQAANGTNTDEDREAIQKEIEQITGEIDRIGETTKFNNIPLFQSSTSNPITTRGITDNAPVQEYTKQLLVEVTGTPQEKYSTNYTISASESGFSINGDDYTWDAFVHSDGSHNLSDSKIEEGIYQMNYKGIDLKINVSDHFSLSEIASKLNTSKVQISSYVVSSHEAIKSVDLTGISEKTYTNVSTYRFEGLPSFQIIANDDGLEFHNSKTGSVSKSTWKEMGIDFDNVKAGVYEFKPASETVGIKFELSEYATKSSVSGALSNMYIQSYATTVKYSYTNTFPPSGSSNSWLVPESKSGTGHEFAKFSGILPGTAINKMCYYRLEKQGSSYCISYQGYGVPPVLSDTSTSDVFTLTSDSLSRLKNQYKRMQDGEATEFKDELLVFKNRNGNEMYFHLKGNSSGKIEDLDKLFDGGRDSLLILDSYPTDITSEYQGARLNNVYNQVREYESYIKPENSVLVNYKETIQLGGTNPPVNPSQPTDPNVPGSAIDASKGLWIQTGANAGEGMFLETDKMNTSVLGIQDLNVSTQSGASEAIGKTSDALSKVSAIRSKIGAQQNRLEYTIANNNNAIENTTSSESKIRDADMATEVAQLARENILEQVGQAMLAQANQSNQSVLQLLG